MKRKDRVKLDFVRNWKFPGQKRFSNWLSKSASIKTALKDGIIWLTDEDIAIYTTTDNFIEQAILTTGTYEAEIAKLIRTTLKTGYVALDIGANIGLQSMRMSQCCSDSGLVYAFEPLTYIRNKFIKNIALNNCNNIKLFPFALSDKQSTITVKINEHTWNQGAFSLKHTDSGETSEQIKVKIADQVPELKQLDKLHLIKIDVEGYEYHVLRGLNALIQKHKPRIIFEYDINYWIATEQKIIDCYNYLTGMGYTFYQVTQVGCELISNPTLITDGNLYCIPQ